MITFQYSPAQENPSYRKFGINVNVTRSLADEVNIGIERWSSSRRSIEINGGIIYVNDFLEERAKDWNNSTLFSEHGYTGRIYYKIHKRVEDNSDSKWRDYIAIGLVYKHLYYNDQWFDAGAGDTVRSIYERRDRDKYGMEFLWGKVYEISPGLALEFYYGAGIMFTSVTRTISKVVNRHSPDVVNYDHIVTSFYGRPVIQAGLKLRFRM
jgi:hypothetical protein